VVNELRELKICRRLEYSVSLVKILFSHPFGFNEMTGNFSVSHISLSMFTIDNSELLDKFKAAFQSDTEWRDAMAKLDDSFSFSGILVFHDNRLFVPSSLRSEILHSHHDSVLAGHPGCSMTYNWVKRDYSWPGMRTNIRYYVSSCKHCSRIKNVTHKPYGFTPAS